MKRKIVLGLALLGVGLAGYVVYIVNLAGEFRTIEPHFDGQCRLVGGVPGPEDVAILRDGSGAFITAQDRLGELAGGPAHGAVFYLDLRTNGAVPRNVTPDAPPNFRPHGLALFEQDGRTSLFVVNHPGGLLPGDMPGFDGPAHTVEIYDFADGTLRHRRTIHDREKLITPNDVAPVGFDQFYVTNDHGTGHRFVRQLEDYSRFARSHVLYFDGETFRRLPGEYHYANGIIASPDGKSVYLAEATGPRLRAFDRDPATNDLAQRAGAVMPGGPDNINIDEAGNLWVAAHPQMLTLTRYMAGKGETSPTQVLRVDPTTLQATEVLLSDGTDMSASTAAARHGNRLLVGSLDARGFLDCTMAARP